MRYFMAFSSGAFFNAILNQLGSTADFPMSALVVGHITCSIAYWVIKEENGHVKW